MNLEYVPTMGLIIVKNSCMVHYFNSLKSKSCSKLNWDEGTLKKLEALDVMHDVLGVLRESVLITGVSLDKRCSSVSKDRDNGGFIIRMRCNLDVFSINCLKPTLEKHGLVLCEENGFVIISKVHP